MDIICTSPKNEMALMAQEAIEAREEYEEFGRAFYYRNTSRMPKELKVGERIWYVEDGYIRGFAKVVSVQEGAIISDATSWTWIKPVKMRGFQGWRYFDTDKFEKQNGVTLTIVGNWLDPRPEAVRC